VIPGSGALRGELALLDDTTLMARLSEGDGAALDAVVARHAGRVRSYLAHLLDDSGWADDLTQEVFVRVHTRARSYDGRWPLLVWLLRIARNLAVDLVRRERVAGRGSARGEIDSPIDHHTPLAAAEASEFRTALRRALAQLPEPLRTVFVLREIELLDYDEIAAVLGVPAKTVSTRLHRARTRLRTLLASHLEGGR
jgi:RNA polymerase sigma-70 factor (ECF subfamily)